MFNTKSFLFISLTLLALLGPILTQSLTDSQEVLCTSARFLDVCPKISDRVCVALPQECSTTPCFQTFEILSGCEACKTDGVKSYTPGKCQYTCDAVNLPPPGTSIISDLVCAIYLNGCLDASCRSTFESSIIACQDPDVISFSFGACPGEPIPSEPQEVVCAAATFPDVCPDIYEPVCVDAPKECSTTPCYQTDEISSGCEACKTEGVQSYTPGKCQYTCDAGNLPPPGSTITSDPVCAIYLKGCLDAACRSTFESSTDACQDPDVISFSLGACPDASEPQEVLCAAAIFPDVCPDIYEPVCVASPKECFTTPCYQADEISSGCEACKTEGVQSYTPGKCQYTCDAGNLPPPGTGITSGPVCAIYLEDCQDASCRNTFESSTVACQDPDVVSFSLGPCPDEDETPTEECNSEYGSEEECLLEEEFTWGEEEHDWAVDFPSL